MLPTEPTQTTADEQTCESCGQPVASDVERCPECDDRPTISPPVGYL